jgi:hypothetical protein
MKYLISKKNNNKMYYNISSTPMPKGGEPKQTKVTNA